MGFCQEIVLALCETVVFCLLLFFLICSSSLGWFSGVCMRQSIRTSCRTSLWSIQPPYSWYCRGYYLYHGPPCYFASSKSNSDVLHVWRCVWLWKLLYLLCCANYNAQVLHQKALVSNRARSYGVWRGINCNEPHHSGLVDSELMENHIYCHGRDVVRDLHIVLFIRLEDWGQR